MSELVSVIMPAYNAKAHIEKAVSSILQQTYAAFELIVTDDNSTDGTFELLQSFTDSRIKLFRNTVNSGVAATLNHCLKNASGELIAVMHADDIALPSRLKEQVSYLSRYKDVDIIGSHCLIINVHDQPIKNYDVLTRPLEILLYVLLKQIPFLHPSVLYKRAVLEKTGWYKSEYDGMEDHDLWLRMAGVGVKFGNVPAVLMRYREHATQVSQNFSAVDIEKNYRIYEDFVQSLGMQKTAEDVRAFCDVCNKGFVLLTKKELLLFLSFFEEVLIKYPFLSLKEKNYFKRLIVAKIISRQSKKKLSTYTLLPVLLKWRRTQSLFIST